MKSGFKSTKSFILASVGAAVGLGNVLRFPGLCAKYGGGAFLLVYVIAMLLLGVPFLNAEIGLGRMFGSGSPNCLSQLGRKKKSGFGQFIGWAECGNSVFTSILYVGIGGWLIAEVFEIVKVCRGGMSTSEISADFFNNVLHATDGNIERISPLVLAGIFVALIFVCFCLRGGADRLSKAAKFTVAVPVAFLILLAGRGLLYENCGASLTALFLPDFSALSSPKIWLTALGQVFFSLSIVVGIMPSFGGQLPPKTNIFKCSVAIAAADLGVSLLASVVMFTTLYGCNLQSEIASSGIITAFAVYPAAFYNLFGANVWANCIAGVLFYSSLFLLAVQSGVSMAEAFVQPFAATFNISRKKIAAGVCGLGLLLSWIFATSAGKCAVEISDKYINFYNILAMGLTECILIAGSGRVGGLCDEINKYTKKLKMPRAMFTAAMKYLSPLILGGLCVIQVLSAHETANGWAVFAFGIMPTLIALLCAFILSRLTFRGVVCRRASFLKFRTQRSKRRAQARA